MTTTTATAPTKKQGGYAARNKTINVTKME